MKITILSLFKDAYQSYLESSIIKRAIKNKIIDVEIVDFRQYSTNKHHKVDDYQFGGGPGMVLSIQPIADCLKSITNKESHVILTSASAKLFNQDIAKELSLKKHLILIAGHYEGFDARIENYVDASYSIGDYVLTGGELPSLVILDAIVRLIPGVINQESLVNESFENNLLDYPVYTKPIEYDGYKVPEVLLSGDHKKIANFRFEKQLEITKKNRLDIYEKYLKERKQNEN